MINLTSMMRLMITPMKWLEAMKIFSYVEKQEVDLLEDA